MKNKRFLPLLVLPFFLASCDLNLNFDELTREEANQILQDIMNHIEENKTDYTTSSYTALVNVYDEQGTLQNKSSIKLDDNDYKFEMIAETPKTSPIGQASYDKVIWIDGTTIKYYDRVISPKYETDVERKYMLNIEDEQLRVEKFHQLMEAHGGFDLFEVSTYLVTLITNPTIVQDELPGLETSYTSSKDGWINGTVKDMTGTDNITVDLNIEDYKVKDAYGNGIIDGTYFQFDLEISYMIPFVNIPLTEYNSDLQPIPDQPDFNF